MKFKRMMPGIMALCMVASFSIIPIHAQDTFDYDEAYDWAVGVGYPEEFLDSISGDPTMLRDIYCELKDVDEVEVFASHETMSRGSNDQARGNISSSDLDFWMVAAKASIDGYISFINVHIAYEWLASGFPWSEDAVAVNWDATLWAYDQATSGFEAVMRGGGIGGYAYETLTNPAQAVQGGIGWFCDVNALYDDIYGCASFKLFPRDSQLPNGSRYLTSINATYAHSTVTFSSLTIGISEGSITISGDKDEISTTESIYYGV